MPVRDIVLTALIVGLLPFCFQRPWVGVLVWSWIGYMNPHRLTWSFAYSLPFAQMVAIVTLGGLLMTRDRAPLPKAREVWLLLLFWAHVTVTSVFAFYPAEAWGHWTKVSKIYLMVMVSLILMQRPERVRWLLWVTGLSLGFYGLKGGVWAVMTGGGNMVLGPPASFISGNTEIGLALIMTLPILLYLRRLAARRWLRWLVTATFVFSIVATLITYSRGALLGLGVVLALLFLKSKSKILALTLMLVGVPLAMTNLPDKWFGRMETLQTYEEDRSARGRLDAWQVATRIAGDHPFMGGGFRTFTREQFARYGFPEGRDAHSIYFQVLGEHGFVGLALYLGLILSTLLSLRRLAWRRPDHPGKAWIPECARMVEASLVGYLIAGAFLSMSYFDLFYGLVALTVLLKVLAAQPVPAEQAAAPAVAPPPVPTRRPLPAPVRAARLQARMPRP